MKKKVKFRVNDIVITKNNSLAIIEEVDDEDNECSVNFLCNDHTKWDEIHKYKYDYNSWHSFESLKLVARLKGLKQLIKLATIAYKQKKL